MIIAKLFGGRIRDSGQRGITVIEVLAAVGILAFLMAVATPVFTHGIVMARQQRCAGNLRQIGVALNLYAADHDGWLPGTTHERGADFRKAWIHALKPYVGGVDRIRICPADPKGAERLEADGTSYILNSYVFVPRVGPFGEALGGSMNNVRFLPQPSRTLYAANISDRQGVSVQSDHTHSERWGGEEGARGNWNQLCNDIQPDRFTSNPTEDHTNGSANYLFADGHVENIQASVVKERLERGDNIAKPPES